MTIRSAAKHRKSRPASRVPVGSRRWVAALVPVLAVVTAGTVAGGVSTAVAADNPNPTVTVGGDPRGVAVDPDSRHAFVTNYSENSVSVIDTAAGKVLNTVAVGVNPTSVAVFPRDHYAFVTNYYGNSLSVINIANSKLVGTVPVGVHPDGVAIDPKGQFAFVTNSGSNSVSVIDIHTQKLARTILVGRAPQKVAIDRDGKHAYVTNFGDNTVSVINLPNQVGVDLFDTLMKVNNTIAVGINPRGLALDNDSHHAFVVSVAENTVTTIDTAKGTILGSSFVGYDPDEVAVAPDHTAYVTARADGVITVIRPS